MRKETAEAEQMRPGSGARLTQCSPPSVGVNKSNFITWQPRGEDVSEGEGVRDGRRGGVPGGERGSGCHRSAGPFIEDLMDAL